MSFILAVLYCAPPDPTGTSWNHSDSKLDLIFHLDSNWIPTGTSWNPTGSGWNSTGIEQNAITLGNICVQL